MATKSTPLPEPWTTHILSDSQHFTQTSQVSGDEPGLTAAKYSISLDLEDPTIANAIKAIVTKDTRRVDSATAEDPALAEYLSRLGISIPQGDSVNLAQRFTPARHSGEDDQNHKDGNPIIPDHLHRTSNASLSAGDGGRFPTLVAVTQECLNAQLHARWNAEVDLDRSELRNIVVPDGDDAAPSSFPAGVFIDANLAAPQISLLVESEESPSSALFYLKFLEGRCALWDDEIGALYGVPSTYGWSIAFKVDLQLCPMYNSFEYRCLASQWGLPPSYQINSLIVSFNKVTIDIASSTFPTPLPASVHANLANLVISNLCRRTITINYAVTNPSTSPATLQGPTVPPTALRLQTYPYRRSVLSKSGSISTTSPVNDSPLNTLLYLPTGMSSPGSQLPWSTNWVTSEVSEDISRSGALVLGRETLFDNFLLPKLAALNKATYLEMKVAETKKTGAVQAEYKFSVGRKDDLGEEEFAWPKMAALNTGEGVLRYMWSRSSKISDQAGGNGFGSKVRGTTLVRNVLIVRGGTNRIRWETEAQIKLETELEIFGVTNKGVSTAWRKGATDIIVEEVDGKLGLRIDLHQGWIKTGSTGGGTSFGFQEEELQKLRRELQMRYLNRDQINAMVDGVNARLTRDWAWVYPAFGESFTMKNPVFSEELDLLVDLAYVMIQAEELY